MFERHEKTRSLQLRGFIPALCVLLVTSAVASTVQAELGEEEPDRIIWAARACYLEASFRESDCIALLYVAKKRAGRVDRPWFEVLREYSALDADNSRAREVRTYPWGDIAGKPPAFNARWRKLRKLVVDVAGGKHRNPCPRAEHWGGTMDRPRGRMIPARCAVNTANTFYTLRPRPASPKAKDD